MTNITVDFSKKAGKMKPMHSVNNGPVYKFAVDQRITNMDAYRAAGIPFARTHDASFFATYGGEHTVDVNFIFTDFDADPEDPASYDFTLTDEYMRVIAHAGTEVFYRLGSKIEHWPKKYNTLPPKDFKKWAVICEHIIRHYNEGWADGFHMGIRYWEIWNEPNLDPDDSKHKRCWGGTKAEFFDFYEIAAKHLKSCFPSLKIGGPAVAGVHEWARDFLNEMKKREVPIDFFSWHRYDCKVEGVQEKIRLARAMMDEAGYTDAESILNEWNYVCGWEGDKWIDSLKAEKSLKGAAFTGAVMIMSQNEPLDNLMYYDARPCGMNGLFSTDNVSICLKGYYPFYMFGTLYRLGTAVESLSDDGDVYVLGAAGEGKRAVMLTYYNDDGASPAKEVSICLKNLGKKRTKITYRRLDEALDCAKVWEECVTSDSVTVSLSLPLYTSYLVEIEEM